MAQQTPSSGEGEGAQTSALAKHLREFDAQALEDEIQAYSFCQDQLRELEATERTDYVQQVTTETLQLVVAAPAAGAMATVRTKKGFPIGGFVNTAVGLAAKALAFSKTDKRALRVLADVGKVFLHSQLSMKTKEVIDE